MDHFYAVIMAGGGGTRLWPISRKNKPKQVLELFGENTPFKMTVDRLQPIIPVDQIYVVTIVEQADHLKEQTSKIPERNFILEPMPRGTASVVGLAATILHHQDPDSVMAVLPSDHFIRNVEKFREVLIAAYEIACEGELVTLGIDPTFPSTGYGYIHQGELITRDPIPAYRAVQFKEKPSLEIAKTYLESNEYVWNSGMFIWKTDRILKEIQIHMPGLSNGLRRIQSVIDHAEFGAVLREVWKGLESKTIDYGIMEKAQRVCVIPAGEMDWIDIGGWDRFFDILDKDENGNIILGDGCLYTDLKESLVFRQQGRSEERVIALLGLEGLVIVETEDVLLICSRERAEEVRSFIDTLSSMGKEQYL
jgi:mannose-1-phosphate guanylyltransferase